MKPLAGIIISLLLLWTPQARSVDVRKAYDLLKKGRDLSANDAELLEKRLAKKPKDEEARIQLLAYYAVPPTGVSISAVKAARSKHILWLIENDPKAGLGLFQVSTGVYRLHFAGDELADPDAATQACELWIQQVKRNPNSAEIRREAVDAIQYSHPEVAEQMLVEVKDHAGLGRLYAGAVLGITGESYLSSDPAGSDPELRKRPFVEKANRALERATERGFLVEAARTLLREGAILWADGKLDWDYTPLGRTLLAKARSVAPNEMYLYTLPTTLPPRGERPPSTLRVGGNVQTQLLKRKVTPTYPPDARNKGIDGTVQLTVLVGLDGRIVHLHVESGPQELTAASVDAVRQWEYRATLLNGKPCYVITRVDVNYRLDQ